MTPAPLYVLTRRKRVPAKVNRAWLVVLWGCIAFWLVLALAVHYGAGLWHGLVGVGEKIERLIP